MKVSPGVFESSLRDSGAPNVFVLGPHRSGTSAVTRLIQRCGFDVGPPDELLGPTEDNPEGYWESHRLVEINDDLLFLFGKDWRSAGPVRLDGLPEVVLRALRQRAETWTDCMDRRGPWVAKDPRLCLTGSFWLQLRPEAHVVLVVRHPAAAVTSLVERKHSPIADPRSALEVWRRHLSGAVTATRGRRRLVVDYDRLLDDLGAETRRIVEWLPGIAVEELADPGVLEKISATIDPNLRGHRASDGISDDCESIDLVAWQAMIQGDEPAMEEALARWAIADSVFDSQNMLQFRRSEVAEILESHRTRLGHRQEQLDELRAQLDRETLELQRRDERIRSLQSKLDRREEEARSLTSGIADRDRQIEALRANLDRRDEEARSLTCGIADRERQIETLLAKLDRRDEQARSLTCGIADRDRQVEILQSKLDHRDERIRSMEPTLRNREDMIAAKDTHIDNLTAMIRTLELNRTLAEREVAALKRSWSYRVGRAIVFPASLVKQALQALRRDRPAALEPVRPGGSTETETTEAGERYGRLREKPLLSIVMPVYNTPPAVLREAVQSVLAQVYREWELCIADDGSTDPATRQALDDLRRRDSRRIKVARLPANRGIAAASNAAAGLATGSFVGFLDHDDLLTPDALLEVAQRLEEAPDTDLVYSDEDKITMDNRLVEPFHKPDFSPEYLLSNNYVCHFTVIRREVFERAGRFREGLDGSQDYDLVLRVAELARQIEHIPRILYHWRKMPGSAAGDPEAKGGLWRDSSIKALQSAVTRRGWRAEPGEGILPGTYRVRFAVDPQHRVTIVIPTKDRVDLLQRCIGSIVRHTRHTQFEILVVCNNCEETETYDFLKSSHDRSLRHIDCNIPFNFARLNNLAVEQCDSPFLLFLNNDIEVTTDGWLASMLEFAQQEPIGAVGARLLYSNDTVQHAGVVVGMLGVAGHLHRHLPADQPGYFGWANVVRNCSAVTGACMLTRRDVFDAVGGFTEELAVAFNDIDWCLKVREAGYRIVYTPFACAYHGEMTSRGRDDTPETAARFRREIAEMLARWGHLVTCDPYYNPNLTLMREDCGLFNPEQRREFEQYLTELRLQSTGEPA